MGPAPGDHVRLGFWNRTHDWLKLSRRPSPFFEWCIPDAQIAWFTTLPGILLARKVDCVYVSCAPFSSALSACVIKWATGKPVILDFRDAWALNPHANLPSGQRRAIAALERWVVRTCDALILNTRGSERCYKLAYPEHAAKMTYIPNGFDRLNVPTEKRPHGKFTIMHVGDFYRSRTPLRLLEALAKIGNSDIEFVQIGPSFEAHRDFKDKVSIRLMDRVTHAEALKLMQSASLLYLCQGWESGVTDYIAVASKTYEYLATGLPILADCPPGDNADIVREYAQKAWVISAPDRGAMEAAVREAYATRGETVAGVTSAFVERFKREHLTQTLANMLDRATHAKATLSGTSVHSEL